LVHPIALADYRDFRPVITGACASFGHPLPRDVPPSAEALAWLGLPAPDRGEPIRDGVIRGSSGWAAARTGGGAVSVFVRAGSYTSRPGQIDPLQLDVRFGSREVVTDAGTFSYNSPPPWRNALASGAVHNGPILDDEEPGIRGPRFLWYVWPSARIVSAEMEGEEAVIVAEIPDRVRRTVRVMADRVIVRDEVLAPNAWRARIRWLLHPNADPSSVRVEGGSRLVEAREGEPAGWFSPTYGERAASRYVEVEREVTPGMRIVTEILGFASKGRFHSQGE
ncbi:MAG TPA: heparinase II/III family protein, partial [Gemmatimonadaceae bacterium]